ncbi:MAG: FkbM family methyltransferase [Ectothiorhodospiraceae bacterium]|nr:FkbM family methyltransferase [Ectothiorhodospiraceae bacterium]
MADPLVLPPTVAVGACRYGQMLYLTNDRYIGRSLHVYGEFSEAECALLRRLIGPGAWAVEAGANVGAHTLGLARAVGVDGRVVAFEPQPLIHRLLEANVVLAATANVEVHGAAVGRAPGTLRVPPLDYSVPGNFGGVSLVADDAGVEVTVCTVDGLRLARCDLLKADVEGMERDVLDGAARTIERHRPVLYLENDRRERSPALVAALLGLGYRIYWHLPPLFNPANFRGRKRNLFPGIVSANLLCLPDDRPPPLADPWPVRAPEEWWR